MVAYWRSKKPKVLNLGCGDNPIQGAWNVDITDGEKVDEVYNLLKFPWKWETGSIDKIYLVHVLEHFEDTKRVIKECHRILRKGGLMEVIVPHSSSAMSVGCLGHYRTFSYNTLNDYLCRPFYLFKKALFKTRCQKLRWWYGRKTTNVPLLMLIVIIPLDKIISFLANLEPKICENLWCYWVGGFREVVWVGEKI